MQVNISSRKRTATYILCCYICCASCNSGANNATFTQDTARWPASFEIGRPATQAEIAALDIDVRPDGKGLPPGAGNVRSGKIIYMAKCAACHGTGKEPVDAKLPAPVLMNDSAGADYSRLRTIGNYWPYATTVFDYIRRAMPYNAPGTLTDNEVYSLTAYLLYANNIIGEQTVINAGTLPTVSMPAKKLFIPGNRQGAPAIR
jgi:cytochrome c